MRVKVWCAPSLSYGESQDNRPVFDVVIHSNKLTGP